MSFWFDFFGGYVCMVGFLWGMFPIRSDFVGIITDLFQITSDFVVGYHGPDRDKVRPDWDYSRGGCCEFADREGKLIYPGFFNGCECYEICRKSDKKTLIIINFLGFFFVVYSYIV